MASVKLRNGKKNQSDFICFVVQKQAVNCIHEMFIYLFIDLYCDCT